MSIYGNSIIGNANTSSLLERYIDEIFLEDVLEESARFNVNKELKKLKKKEDIKVEDYQKILDQIKKINSEDEAKRCMMDFNKYYREGIGYYVSALVAYVGTAVAAVATNSIEVIAGGFAGIYALCGISIYKMVKATNGYLNIDEENYKNYQAFMKAEAKAKKELNKAEKLDNKELVNKLQKFIDVCEEIKKEQKTAAYNFSNYQPRKDKFKVNESVEEFIEEADETVLYEERDLLLEYKGNEVKTNIFIQVLDDIDKMFKTRSEIIGTLDDAGMKVINMTKKVNAENSRDIIQKIHEIDKQTKATIAKVEGYYPELTKKAIKANVNRFCNKYSQVTMPEKKKLQTKLEQYKKQMQDFGYKYEEESQIQKEWLKIIEKMENDNIKGAYGMANYALGWYKEIINYVNDTIQMINDIEKMLDIKKTEKSIIFKVLNFKYLRDQKKAAKEANK